MSLERGASERGSVEGELPLFRVERESPNVEWFCGWLAGRDWVRAEVVLKEVGRAVTENEKRKVRAWANASGGRVCGHQRGYKLTTGMTKEEFQWWENETLKAKDALERRVIEARKVFYARAKI